MTTRKPAQATSSGEALGLKLLESVRQMKARNFARVTEVAVNEVVEARQSTGMSQSEFASALSISKRTLQEWEQGRRAPSGAAQALIRIARKHPEVVREALEETGFTVEVLRLAAIDWKRAAADAVFVFECRITGGKATPSEESSEVRFFDVAQPPDAPTKIIDRIRDIIASPDRVLLRSTS